MDVLIESDVVLERVPLPIPVSFLLDPDPLPGLPFPCILYERAVIPYAGSFCISIPLRGQFRVPVPVWLRIRIPVATLLPGGLIAC